VQNNKLWLQLVTEAMNSIESNRIGTKLGARELEFYKLLTLSFTPHKDGLL